MDFRIFQTQGSPFAAYVRAKRRVTLRGEEILIFLARLVAAASCLGCTAAGAESASAPHEAVKQQGAPYNVAVLVSSSVDRRRGSAETRSRVQKLSEQATLWARLGFSEVIALSDSALFATRRPDKLALPTSLGQYLQGTARRLTERSTVVFSFIGHGGKPPWRCYGLSLFRSP